jgi:hypothetical protein
MSKTARMKARRKLQREMFDNIEVEIALLPDYPDGEMRPLYVVDAFIERLRGLNDPLREELKKLENA